ncbi:MAG: glycosyltransferase [Aureispira sp.]
MPVIQHIYWFAPYNLTCPSTRYRGLMPLQKLKEQGVNYDFFYPEATSKAYLRFLYLVIGILLFRKKNSLLVIQKVCSTGLYGQALCWLIRLQPQMTLYDLDDAEYYRQPTSSLHFFLEHCQWVQVGSHALAAYARQFNQQVYINTSPVPLPTAIKQKKNACLTLGWVGDFGNGKAISKEFAHKTSLFKLLFPVLKELDFSIKLVLIGVKRPEDIPLIEAYFEEDAHIQLEIPSNLDWTNDDWLYDQMATFDVGLSPLVEHPFNTAKSAFKAKQYLACGVPTIASAVGENALFVQDYINGRLCTSADDWKEALCYFEAMDEQAYTIYSTQARAGQEQFSLSNYVQQLLTMTQ